MAKQKMLHTPKTAICTHNIFILSGMMHVTQIQWRTTNITVITTITNPVSAVVLA